MTVTIQIEVTPADVANAAAVLQGIYFNRSKSRELDRNAGRTATAYEDEAFHGLSVANIIVDRVSKAVNHG